MQQHLMQMQQQQQPMMAGYNPSNVTTDHIQQYLDENKSLILKILENQNSGKLSECAENQARLQRNLMYLAAIADSQPQQPAMHAQFPNAVVQPGAHYMQHQQAQSMMPQSMMNTRSPMLYSQQQLSSIQQQQQQQAMHNQLGMSSGGNNNGLHMMHNESGMGGGNGPMGGSGFPDFGRTNANEGLQGSSRGVTIASKHESGSAGSGDHGRGGNSGGQGGESGEQMYLKSGEEGN